MTAWHAPASRPLYEDLLRFPEHLVAEIVDGELSPAAAVKKFPAASVLGSGSFRPSIAAAAVVVDSRRAGAPPG